MLTVLIILIYIIGCIVYCMLAHNKIGTKECSWESWGPAEHTIDATSVVLESFFWPIMLCTFIVLSPIIIGTFLLDKYHDSRARSNLD